MKASRPLAIRRKVDPTKRRAAAKSITANIRRLQKSRTTRTARQTLAEARADRLRRSR